MRRLIYAILAAVLATAGTVYAARAFDDASTEYLEVSSALVTEYPWYAAGWVRVHDVSNKYKLFSVTDEATFEYWHVTALGGETGNPLRFGTKGGGTTEQVDSSNGLSANVWTHVFVAANASDDRICVLGGSWSDRGTGTGDITPSAGALSITNLGTFDNGSKVQPIDGDLAEWAIWKPSSAYSSAEQQAMAEQLAEGIDPRMIRPGDLIHYWPLMGRDSPEPDLVGGEDMSLVNSPTTGPHPPMIRPGRPR